MEKIERTIQDGKLKELPTKKIWGKQKRPELLCWESKSKDLLKKQEGLSCFISVPVVTGRKSIDGRKMGIWSAK